MELRLLLLLLSSLLGGLGSFLLLGHASVLRKKTRCGLSYPKSGNGYHETNLAAT